MPSPASSLLQSIHPLTGPRGCHRASPEPPVVRLMVALCVSVCGEVRLILATEEGTCYDESPKCAKFAEQGRCNDEAESYASHCLRSCALCGKHIKGKHFTNYIVCTITKCSTATANRARKVVLICRNLLTVSIMQYV